MTKCCCLVDACEHDPVCTWHRQMMRSSMYNRTAMTLRKQVLKQAEATAAELGSLTSRHDESNVVPTSLTPSCKQLEFRGHRAKTCSKVIIPHLHPSERYGDVVRCGGFDFFLTRVDRVRNEEVWDTLVRLRVGNRSGTPRGHKYSRPWKTTQFSRNADLTTHNAAGVCAGDGKSLVLFGGRDMDTGKIENGIRRQEHGIYRVVAPVEEAVFSKVAQNSTHMIGDDRNLLNWTSPELVLSGDPLDTGCIERRDGVARCEFDGKLSVVRYRGQLLLFARANVSPVFDAIWGNGGRHLQVALSSDEGKTWRPFRMVDFDGYMPSKANNIYYAIAAAFMTKPNGTADEEQQLALIFPAAIRNRGGVWVAFSSDPDGVQFTAPELIMESPILQSGRTADHPVAMRSIGAANRAEDANVSIIIEHSVRMQGSVSPPYFREYVISRGADGGIFPFYPFQSHAPPLG